MFNLYSAAKSLYSFQREYHSLFSEYSSLDHSFAQQELENTLTLVNVWRDVLDSSPKGQAIAYNAKQRYRKGTTLFRNLLLKVSPATEGTVLETANYAYIVSVCNTDEGNSLETEVLFGIADNKIVIEAKWIDTNSKKAEVLKTLAGLKKLLFTLIARL